MMMKVRIEIATQVTTAKARRRNVHQHGGLSVTRVPPIAALYLTSGHPVGRRLDVVWQPA
jgi:hypothetical protein